MAQLNVEYLGLALKNPLIAGACKLTSNLDKLKQIEEAGAGAVVIKSIFEEEIQLERFKFDEDNERFDNLHPEMVNIFPQGIEHGGPEEHLMWTRKAKEALSIPVIGSLNAVEKESWFEYAAKLEQTGVDALEINFYSVPTQFGSSAESIENDQIAIAAEIVKQVKLPVSVKLSPYYTNPLNIITRLSQVGPKGFVLFNRLFQPAIDIDEEKNIFPFNLSSPGDIRLPLRFTGLLYGQTSADICSSTGIYSGKEALSFLLAGATCFQVVSAMYTKGIKHIGAIINDIQEWMSRKEYATIDEFRGKLSRSKSNDPWIYTRAQYASMLLHSDEIISNSDLAA
ncbi:MAG: dihydroorotate dehydrogenase-like protein [Chitinivibrionales bacterium]|nr:dihydroorotate dehydrogenase-like protein [Chitinivibrionales bacterium]